MHIFYTPHFLQSSFSTLLIFHTRIFHTTHFPRSPFSTLPIFYTPHFPHSAFSILHVFHLTRNLGSGPHTPHQMFLGVPPGHSLLLIKSRSIVNFFTYCNPDKQRTNINKSITLTVQKPRFPTMLHVCEFLPQRRFQSSHRFRCPRRRPRYH